MVAASALVPAVVIGGVTYTLVKANDGAASNGGATRYGTSYGNTVGQQLTSTPISPTPKPTGSLTAKLRMVNAATVSPLAPKTNWNYSDGGTPINIDPELAKKLAYLEQQAKEQFENMNEVAKAQAADYLNEELKLDPPLNGHEDWKTVAAVVGGAAGAAAGAWIGGPIGAKVGAMVGAYLGVKLYDVIEKNYDEMKAWCEAKWGALKAQIEETWEDIKDGAGDALDWINPF